MNWNQSLEKAITYIEENLLEDFSFEDVAKEAAVSSLYLQKGFAIATGISMGEYIRNRRLYSAANEIINSSDVKITDLAFKYGYETSESFSKAFYRFHGTNPASLKKNPDRLKVFLPLKIDMNIKGGYENSLNENEIIDHSAFKIAGFKKQLQWETFASDIPAFYRELEKKYAADLKKDYDRLSEVEKACRNFRIGEFALTMDKRDGTFDYVVGGLYIGQKIPEEMEVFEIPRAQWAKFKTRGKMPSSIQNLINDVFEKWLPNHSDCKPAFDILVERYDTLNYFDATGEMASEVWIPIR